VDPRDQVEVVDAPSYRVCFWHGATSSDEYEIDEADVPEVLAWAHDNAFGRTYSVSVALLETSSQGVHLVRLAGWDASAPASLRPPHAWTLPDAIGA
jgi:hypothetical protein